MRLLNVRTLDFKVFLDSIPPYVVASHRWIGEEETTLDDITHGQKKEKSGYQKVLGFAKFVRLWLDDVEWLWIDTACVNQQSDREVSEAVNSMFRWYSNAELCLAYLADVEHADERSFRNSAWFRRGWTLQELLAPNLVVFLSHDWRIIGRKGGSLAAKASCCQEPASLERWIAEITGIPSKVLVDYLKSKDLSVKERLAWIDGRRTTRKEDMSYSLFGIFDVALPVIYGEGEERARRRLLREIQDLPIISTTAGARSGHTAEVPLQPLNTAVSNLTLQASANGASAGEHSLLARIHNAARNAYDDDEVETVNEAIDRGDAAFKCSAYWAAEPHLRKALSFGEQLPGKQRNRYDLDKVAYQLAVCAFYVHDSDVAATALNRAITRLSRSVPAACELWHVEYLLSQIGVEDGKLGSARQMCERSHDLARTQLDKGPTCAYQSLALLSNILGLQGDEKGANELMDTIPDQIQKVVTEPLSLFGPLRKLRWSGTKIIQGVDAVVTCMTFSPDSRILASGLNDGTIRLCDVATGDQWKEINIETRVCSVAFSPDGRVLAYGMKGACKLWKIASGRMVRTVRPFDGVHRVEGITFSSDGKLLACCTTLQGITVWHTDNGTLFATFEREDRRLYNVSISPDGKLLAAVSITRSTGSATDSEEGVVLWSLEARSRMRVLRKQVHHAATVAFSHDSRRLTVTSFGSTGSSEVWDIDSERRTEILWSGDDRDCTIASCNGKLIVFRPVKGAEQYGVTIDLLNVSSRRWDHGIACEENLSRVAVAPNNRIVALGKLTHNSQGGFIELRDLGPLPSGRADDKTG